MDPGLEPELEAEADAEQAWQNESTQNELLYLSLPANDDIGYYTPTDESSRGSRESSLSTGEEWDFAYTTAGTEAVEGPATGVGDTVSVKGANSWGKTEQGQRNWDRDDYEDPEEVYQFKRRKLDQAHGLATGNRGNKLHRSRGVRWVRSGKLSAWSERRLDKEVRVSCRTIRE